MIKDLAVISRTSAQELLMFTGKFHCTRIANVYWQISLDTSILNQYLFKWCPCTNTTIVMGYNKGCVTCKYKKTIYSSYRLKE